MLNKLKTQIRKVLKKGKPQHMNSFEWDKYKEWAKEELKKC